MIKVVIDTGVLMSNIGGYRATDIEREYVAKGVLNFLTSNSSKFALYYSERTQEELIRNTSREIALIELNKYEMLPSHILDQTWGETGQMWQNIATIYGDERESDLAGLLRDKLPDKRTKSNRNDRGITGDAIMNYCDVILTENPKDFNKLQEECEENGILLINLIKQTSDSVISKLQELPDK